MKLGMIGLGRMGGDMTRRLLKFKHDVVVSDLSPEAVEQLSSEGAIPSKTIENLISQLDSPRCVWVMVPAGKPTEQTLHALRERLSHGDIVIDGGNSNYKESRRHGEAFAQKGISFLDVGTSGGIWGLREGYCLMVGGADEAVKTLTPIFQSLAPSPERGWIHVGPVGSGHFTKMIHNGIEYGMMQAMAEGFELLHHKSEFNIDLGRVAEVWRHGSVVRSWLLDLTAEALKENPTLDGIKGWVSDSGEGRWTVEEAIEQAIPAPVITQSLFARFASRQEESFAAKILASMRNKFGGHAMKTEK